MKVSSLVAVGLLAALAGNAPPAEACGGCFTPTVVSSAADTLVTGHRMAFAISKDRTVLWDQIQFSGSPEEFGWVLPVKPGSYIEESTDAWFEALETVTKVQVASPQVTCPPPAVGTFGSSGSGCGCSSDESASASPSSNFIGGSGVVQPPPVTVVHRGTVGAYETVTLSSRDGTALRNWLGNHGYTVPPDIEPVIDAYVSEGADFIALRLIPGKGINEMTPVRVVTPGGDAVLPLRMVAAGTGSLVDIVLYVIGEGRYGLLDLTESQVNLDLLNFDFAKDQSNYARLRDDALKNHNGVTYVTPFAHRQAFVTSYLDGNGTTVSFSDTANNSYSNFTSLYFGQANINDGAGRVATACSEAVFNRLSTNEIVGPHPGDAGTTTGPVALDYTCDGHSDIAAAVIGMRPNDIWVARLEMTLPRDALVMDCNVGLASPEEVSSQLKAHKASNVSCPGGVITGGVAQSFANSASTCAWAIGSFLSLVIARRFGRRRPESPRSA
jgi:hypothetical protein